MKKSSKRFLPILIIRIFLFAVLLSLFPSPNIYFRPVPQIQGVNIYQDFDLPEPPPFPANRNLFPFPEISAKGLLIKDIPSGVILYAKNEKMRFPPASTTKIMTAMISLENYRLDDVLSVKSLVKNGRTMGLITGEKMTVESLLYGALVHSANDAAYTLAENYPGGVRKFVQKMNEKAQELYLSDTHFENPVGFDHKDHYTTAYDLAKLAQVALHNKTFAKIVGTKSITVSDVSFSYFHNLENVNKLLGKIAGVSGVKTGFTQNAGEILVSEVKRNDRSLLFVVLKSRDRFGETQSLINWAFDNFAWVPLHEVIPTILQKPQVNTR